MACRFQSLLSRLYSEEIWHNLLSKTEGSKVEKAEVQFYLLRVGKGPHGSWSGLPTAVWRPWAPNLSFFWVREPWAALRSPADATLWLPWDVTWAYRENLEESGCLSLSVHETRPLSSWKLLFLGGSIINISCDGQFYVLTWLGYSTQLFNETLIWVLLWRYLVDTVNIHNQSSLIKGDYSWQSE